MQSTSNQPRILGVVGGLGPLASAVFLRTLYERDQPEREQDAPAVVLYSDPSCPPRTEALLDGREGELLSWLTAILERLERLDVARVVLCCVTMHAVLPRVPDRLRARVLSLVDAIFTALAEAPEGRRHLMICSTGTSRVGVFQGHPRAALLRDRVIFPGEDDQAAINALIHRIKANGDPRALSEELAELLGKYGVQAFIAGCTEIHLLAREPVFAEGNERGYSCIDPLTLVADRWARERRHAP
jgi:aspartate racemase